MFFALHFCGPLPPRKVGAAAVGAAFFLVVDVICCCLFISVSILLLCFFPPPDSVRFRFGCFRRAEALEVVQRLLALAPGDDTVTQLAKQIRKMKP